MQKKHDVTVQTEIDCILSWAARDQDECRQCGDERGEREARENLAMIERFTPLLLAAPDLLEAAREAETFIAGFEDDETQKGVKAMLRRLRAVISRAGEGKR